MHSEQLHRGGQPLSRLGGELRAHISVDVEFDVFLGASNLIVANELLFVAVDDAQRAEAAEREVFAELRRGGCLRSAERQCCRQQGFYICFHDVSEKKEKCTIWEK